jgi:hypothetical protein
MNQVIDMAAQPKNYGAEKHIDEVDHIMRWKDEDASGYKPSGRKSIKKTRHDL